MKAYTGKNNIIDTIGDHVGGESRPTLFASGSKRRQHLPTPPRHKLRGSIGSSYFGCARCDLRRNDRSRLSVPLSQYEPNDSARVGEGRSGGRGRVLSQSLLVARERRRRELGSNLVIVTTTFTSGEGHVVEDGISRRVRKILAGVPASVSFRDLILALSLSREERQHWTVGYRPIRKNDLRSLHRNSVEAQIQDRSRQKTGLKTAPGFSRVSNKPPSPSRSEGDACAARRGCTKFTTPVIPAGYPVIPADAGTQRKTKHAAYLTTQITAVTSQATTCPRVREQSTLPLPGCCAQPPSFRRKPESRGAVQGWFMPKLTTVLSLRTVMQRTLPGGD